MYPEFSPQRVVCDPCIAFNHLSPDPASERQDQAKRGEGERAAIQASAAVSLPCRSSVHKRVERRVVQCFLHWHW